MFKTWLKNNDVSAFEYSKMMFPDATDRKFWDARFDADAIAIAERYLGFDWPIIKATDFMEFKKSGDRIIMEKPHFRRRQALCTLVLAEVLENKDRFIPDIVNGIFAICEETYWGLSAHWADVFGVQNIPRANEPYVDLFAGETAASLAWTYYMLFDKLHAFCPEICENIVNELDRRVVKPYLCHRDWWWMGYNGEVNNWNPWILSNILSVFLITVHEKATLCRGIEKMLTEAQAFYRRYPLDGACDEGCSYWTQAGASLFEFVEQLCVATDGKINFYNDEKFCNMGKYEYRMYIGDGMFVNFADGPRKLGGTGAGVTYLFGKRIGDKSLMALGREFFGHKAKFNERDHEAQAKLRRMLTEAAYKKEMLSCPEIAADDFTLLPDTQIAVLRKNSLFLAVKGGNNDEGHNHNDVGSFVLYDNTKPVLIDAGVEVYTRKTFSSERYTIWTMQSSWHNLPEINGIAQHNGRNFRADDFSADKNTVNVSFAGAYPEAATKIDRKYTLHADSLDIRDTFVFNRESNSVTEHLLTCFKPEITENGVLLDKKYLLTCAGDVTVDEKDITYDSRLNASWGEYGVLYRIGFTSASSDITICVKKV